MEIEAKFSITDPGTYWRLQMIKQLAGFMLSTRQTKHIHDTYLDTKKRRILEAGYSFRRREHREGTVMTLKSLSGAEGAIHRRTEWEIMLPSDLPPAKWPDSPLRERLLQLIGRGKLIPLFDLRQTRVIRLLSQDQQPLAELSLDSVSLTVGGKEQVYWELEIGLASPTPEETLLTIVTCLQDEWTLVPEPQSKFERAFELMAAMALD